MTTDLNTISEVKSHLTGGFSMNTTIRVVRILAENAEWEVERLNKYIDQHNTVGLRKGKYLKQFKTMNDAAIWLEKTLDPTQFN